MISEIEAKGLDKRPRGAPTKAQEDLANKRGIRKACEMTEGVQIPDMFDK